MVYFKKYFIHLFIMLFLSALVSFSFEDNTGSSEIILDVEHIAIDILNPLKLYLHNDTDEGYFREGDGLNVSIEIEKISKGALKWLGGGKMKHLKMIFTNLETGEEFEVLSQDFGQNIKFGGGGATTGNYSIKITGTKKPTPMKIKITKFYGTPQTEEERNTPYDMVRIESMYIGEYDEAKPRFFVPLSEGDKIAVTTSSTLAIKFKRENDGMPFSVPQGELIAASSETWKLLFNLELPEDNRGLLKLRTSNKRFIDLRIRRYPYIDPGSAAGAGGLAGVGGMGSDSLGGGAGAAGAGEGADPFAGILEGINAGNSDNSALMAKALADLQKSLEEMNKKTFKSKPSFITGSTEEDGVYVVAPKLDLTGKNKLCKSIDFTDKGLYWAYWIGVGNNANDLYKKTQETTLSRNSVGTLSLVEHYASFVTENVNKKVSHPGFKMIETKLANAGEFIEYAIVNETNRAKFENGQKYTPYKPGWSKRNTVVDHGNATMVEGEKLYLCLCNENKMSPLDVYFKYEVYNLEKVQQL